MLKTTHRYDYTLVQCSSEFAFDICQQITRGAVLKSFFKATQVCRKNLATEACPEMLIASENLYDDRITLIILSSRFYWTFVYQTISLLH